jgi:hypothetical protein
MAVTFPVSLFAQPLKQPLLDARASAATNSLNLPDAPTPQGHLLAVIDADANDFTFSSSQTTAPQAPDQAAPAGSKSAADPDKKPTSEDELQRELHQRMAGVIPNFNAVLDGDTDPLTARQKLRASFRSAVDPYQFALAGFSSLLGQATDSHSGYDPVRTIRTGYGQGLKGYSKRYGAAYADQFDGTILGNGVFPAILHQDARYFRKGKGPLFKRALYSASSAFVCRGDNGKRQPNFSNVLGNLASGGISNLYYPAEDRGFALTIEQGFEVTAEGIFGSLLIEFYPDIQRHFRKHPPADAVTAPASKPS